MKKRNENGKIVGTSLLAMIVVLMSISVAAAVPWEGYLVPQDSAGFAGTDTEVLLKADVTATNVVSYQVDIYFDTDIVNITDVDWTGSPFTTNSWHHYGNYIRVGGISFGSTGIPTDTHTLCTLTFAGKSSGVSDIFFTRSSVIDPDGNPITNTYTNGTYTCASEYQETFSKDLVVGWNLISLPLTNATDMTVANVINKSLGGSYDTLYKYDASANSFAALSSTDTMENGVGYFINVTSADTWSYQGTAYESISISLSKGLNCIGWKNTSVALPEALSSIAGKYNYVLRWNATAQTFKQEKLLYDANAPSGFSSERLDAMEKGEGYWIAVKEACTLT